MREGSTFIDFSFFFPFIQLCNYNANENQRYLLKMFYTINDKKKNYESLLSFRCSRSLF